MATKPASLPRWADNQTDPEADLTEPLAAKKDDGWLNDEKPAAGYFNWWWNLVYLWCAYLDDLEAQDFTWTGAHLFSTELVTMYAGLLVSAGSVTFDDDVLCGANLTATSLTTAETQLRHGDQTLIIGMDEFRFLEGDSDATGVQYLVATDELTCDSSVAAGTAFARKTLDLPVNANIKTIALTSATADADDPAELRLKRINIGANTSADISLVQNANTSRDVETSATINHVIEDGYKYSLCLSKQDGTSNSTFYAVHVVWNFAGDP